MSSKNRLTGIDLLRGFAIYAVIVLHSDEPLSISPFGWSNILEFSKFAVPFFLAASFYLSFSKFYEMQKDYDLKARVVRLLIPYSIWSGIYLVYKVLKYVIDGENEKIIFLVQDPVGIIFCGGAAFHLYFLPLLMIGTVWVKLISLLPRQNIKVLHLAFLSVLSVMAYQILLITGNAFNNDQSAAFISITDGISSSLRENVLFRILMVAIAWSVRCLPYIFIAMFLTHPKIRMATNFQSFYILLTILAFILINVFGIYVLPESVYELGRGYLALFLAIAISTVLQSNNWIKDLGVCSFGIYLSHLLLVDTLYIVINRVYPEFLELASSLTLLISSLLILAVCWGLTRLLRYQKFSAFLLLGA